MLKALLTFLVMVGTTCLVFGALGILSWQMAAAVVIGSVIGSALAKPGLSRAGAPMAETTSRTGRS